MNTKPASKGKHVVESSQAAAELSDDELEKVTGGNRVQTLSVVSSTEKKLNDQRKSFANNVRG